MEYMHLTLFTSKTHYIYVYSTTKMNAKNQKQRFQLISDEQQLLVLPYLTIVICACLPLNMLICDS